MSIFKDDKVLCSPQAGKIIQTGVHNVYAEYNAPIPLTTKTLHLGIKERLGSDGRLNPPSKVLNLDRLLFSK